jgi:putative heme-binding domain-containing protein
METVWMNPSSGRTRSEGLALLEELSEIAATHDTSKLEDIVANAFRTSQTTDIGLAILRGASKAWARRSVPADVRSSLLPKDNLVALAMDENGSQSTRTTAISLLGFATNATSSLVRFTEKTQVQAIRIAAIAALARQPSSSAWESLINGFSSDTPPVRRAIIDGLLSNSERIKLLLDAVEAGQIKASEIDLQQVRRLTTHRDAAIKQRAEKVFAAAIPQDRAKALADYQPVLEMKGDALRGQAIFEKNCAACHRIAGVGVDVAPNISDSRTKKFEQLLTDIIQPNRAIDNNYVGYTVRLLDGTVLTGILSAETATSITLRQQGGKEAVLPRSEIEELKSSGQSLMPEGLERQIPPQDMADLLTFIKHWRYLDGRTPLSETSR